MPDSQPLAHADDAQPAPGNGHLAAEASDYGGTAAGSPALADTRGGAGGARADSPRRARAVRRPLAPLRVSTALRGWALGLALVGMVPLVLLLASFISILVRYGPAAWTLDVMIMLACVPAVIAVVWVERRAVASAAGDFVRGVSGTPLLEIMPPPRPRGLAGAWATLRTVGVLPLLVGVVVIICLVIVADVWAQTTGSATLVVGFGAVTTGGLAMLAALLLTLSASLREVGRAVAAREREVGAHFYALTVAEPDSNGGDAGGYTAICAVPAPV